MKVHYTGKLDKLAPSLERKIEARFAKLGKLLDRKSEKEAHVILTSVRHLRRAEITVNWYGHTLVAAETAKDSYAALMEAIEDIEKQILKLRERRRDTNRASGSIRKPSPEPNLPSTPAASAPAAAVQVNRVNHRAARKPMTVEEAIMELDSKCDYVVYQDSETDRVSVLVRRRDGQFDLIES